LPFLSFAAAAAAAAAAAVQALMGGARESCPFLLLRVRRGAYLLRDTLMQINSAKNNGSLKKPLKVRGLRFASVLCMCRLTRVDEQSAS
jgi:hypothetical protein